MMRDREGEQRVRDRGEVLHMAWDGWLMVIVVIVVVRFFCAVRCQLTCRLAHVQDHAFPQLPWHAAGVAVPFTDIDSQSALAGDFSCRNLVCVFCTNDLCS
jgi:hypothetical protein